MNQILRFVGTVFSIIWAGGFFSSVALAESTKALVYGSYSFSDYEVAGSGISDGSGFGFGALFFPVERVYLSYEQLEESGDFAGGGEIDISITDIGGGVVLGRRLDHKAGIGFEHRIGALSTHLEKKDAIGTADKDVLSASYNLGWGLDNGFSVNLSAQTSLDDLVEDRFFGLGVNKSFGKNYLLSVSRDSRDFKTDNDENFPIDVEITTLAISFGVIF